MFSATSNLAEANFRVRLRITSGEKAELLKAEGSDCYSQVSIGAAFFESSVKASELSENFPTKDFLTTTKTYLR